MAIFQRKETLSTATQWTCNPEATVRKQREEDSFSWFIQFYMRGLFNGVASHTFKKTGNGIVLVKVHCITNVLRRTMDRRML